MHYRASVLLRAEAQKSRDQAQPEHSYSPTCSSRVVGRAGAKRLSQHYALPAAHSADQQQIGSPRSGLDPLHRGSHRGVLALGGVPPVGPTARPARSVALAHRRSSVAAAPSAALSTGPAWIIERVVYGSVRPPAPLCVPSVQRRLHPSRVSATHDDNDGDDATSQQDGAEQPRPAERDRGHEDGRAEDEERQLEAVVGETRNMHAPSIIEGRDHQYLDAR